MATYSDYINAVSSRVAERIIKVEVLDQNENVIDEISTNIIGGNINISDNKGLRRSVDIEFENTDGTYIPSVDGYIWMNKKFRVWTGLKINGEDYYISRGVYLCSEPEISSNKGQNTTDIELLDKFALLNGELGGVIENTYIIEVGSNIATVVQDLLTFAGEVKPAVIEPTTETTPYTLIKEAGETFADLLIELANMLSWTCYFDANGYFRFEPEVDIETEGSIWDYTTDEVFYLSSNHKYDFTNVFNNIVVIGDNINGATVRATATDNSETTGINVVGVKTKVINDSLIYNNSLAQERADAELQKSISIVESLDMNVVPVDIIEGGSIITITDTSSDLDGDRFLVKSVSFPLVVQSEMNISAWKGRVIG
jgi:hypothetical protein